MKFSILKRGTSRHWLIGAVTAVAGLGLLTTAGAMRAAAPARPAYLANFPNFAPRLTPQLPGDVDLALKAKLEGEKKFSQVQREFDLYSWQMFLSLNWPTDNNGRAARRITDTKFGPPFWTLWHASSSIFQADGSPPAACGDPPAARRLVLRRNLSKPVSRGLRPFSSQATANADHRRKRFLGVFSAVGELNAANFETSQAFTGPLFDQNGEIVFYEIMIDPNEVDYLCANNLYNINGQIAFNQAGGKVTMPIGSQNIAQSGSWELKLAWRILKDADIKSGRYHMMPATVIDQGHVEREVTVGLVGMHIGHKSASSPQWIWSTFEQVDNVEVDQVANPHITPSFFDPNCWICAVNQEPAADSNGIYPTTPTQVWRAIAIPADKRALNAQAQAALRKMGSVWQYYQLIDTQWPTDPSAPPAAWNGGLPDAVANKPGGDPTPVFLTNITMETYFQGANLFPGTQTNPVNQDACNGAEVTDNAPCPAKGPAVPPVWTSPLNNSNNPVKPGINTLIFATESCMGCHSSAGTFTSYDPTTGKNNQTGQLCGDFSWLLSQKASYVGGGQTPLPPTKIGAPCLPRP
jgi:hypothetical protein